MIVIDINIAKDVGHNIRRKLRESEFAPLDQKIVLQIPGIDVSAVESQRQVVRDKYADMQTQIDASSTPEEIKQALGI